MRHPLLAKLRLPVVAAPMCLVSGPDMVIAAARSGIVGAFPTPNCRTAEQLDEWMSRIVAETAGAPGLWAANLVTHSSNPRLADDLALVAKHKPPIVITALGSPAPVVEAVHGYGGIVLADVVNETLGRKAAAAGADGLVAVASGAGGHTGSLSPFAFLSVLRSFFDGVICVGGAIADGAGVAGAVAAGADLVYMGTRFLAGDESMAADGYKQMVVDAGAQTAERDYGGDPATKWRDLWAAGQGLHAVTAREPVSAIVDTLETGWDAARTRLASYGE